MKIGLTGGICCGKSTTLAVFGRYGFETINLDDYVRQALRGNDRVKDGLRRHFGAECVDADGELLVRKLAQIVFNRHDAREVLESIIHPEIDFLWTQKVSVPTAIEVPLLFENNLAQHFDCTVCVYSSFAAQLSRSIVSRGWDRGELERRMEAQFPVEEKILRADFVLGNCGNLLQLERQMQLLLAQLI
ncbi:MAG: dephospho-CoA kinase [Puniceicoccales bacterium]|nr:dephospho-CoA kinase [Puniceicoccales bacterium]